MKARRALAAVFLALLAAACGEAATPTATPRPTSVPPPIEPIETPTPAPTASPVSVFVDLQDPARPILLGQGFSPDAALEVGVTELAPGDDPAGAPLIPLAQLRTDAQGGLAGTLEVLPAWPTGPSLSLLVRDPATGHTAVGAWLEAPPVLPTSTASAAAAAPTEEGPGGTSCAVRNERRLYAVAPVPDASEEVRADWRESPVTAFSAEVTGHSPENRIYQLAMRAPERAEAYFLSYEGEPLPLAEGGVYRFRWLDDREDEDPDGVALLVEDEEGLVFLGLNARETEGAEARIFGGDRGGLVIDRMPSACRQTVVDACGVELRAAPLRFRDPESGAELLLGPGQGGRLEGARAYDLEVFAHHYRQPASAPPCEEAEDWVVSYRVARVDAGGGEPAEEGEAPPEDAPSDGGG